MNEILLDTMDGKHVSFVGELICQKTGDVEVSDGLKRAIILKLYGIQSGGYVPLIEYRSDDPAEKSGCIAEIVDLFKDIENFLFVFVPEDLLPEPKSTDRDIVEARKKLSTRLRKLYESLSFDFIDEITTNLNPGAESNTATSARGVEN